MKPIHLNLYIVDDDEPTRQSLVSLLNAHFTEFSVRTFASGESFLEGADLDSNGVVIMDLRMEPGISGLEVFKRMQDQKSALVLIFLSGHGTIPDAVRAMGGGAVSWLAKPCSNEELIGVVQRAKDRAAQTAHQRKDRQHALALWSGLTVREKQIAIPAAQGKTSKQISREFAATGIKVVDRTVERHRANAMAKLAVPNTNALQAFILENALDKESIPVPLKRKKQD
jgi:FixJ family two-component response regulator